MKFNREIFKTGIKQAEDNLLKQIRGAADGHLIEKINTIVNEAITGFLGREIIITDKYGDIKGRYKNVDEILKEKFDAFINETVDEKGKTFEKSCSYGKKQSRLEFVLDGRIKARAQEITKKMVDQVEAKIKKELDDAVKHRVTEYLLKQLNISNAIINAIKQ